MKEEVSGEEVKFMKTMTKWLPFGGNDGDSCCGVCSIAKDDMHAHRQRSEDLLLPTGEEREVVMQAGEEGS